LQDMREMLQATRADAVRPFSYFCTCWNVRPSASPSFSWLMPSIIRRMRTRLPTCLSIKLRGFFAILLSLRVSHLFRAACPSIRRPPVAVTRYEKRVRMRRLRISGSSALTGAEVSPPPAEPHRPPDRAGCTAVGAKLGPLPHRVASSLQFFSQPRMGCLMFCCNVLRKPLAETCGA
jgi:hypothetical protein